MDGVKEHPATVMGVDIERGASFSRAVRYAAAVYVDGGFVHHRHLSRRRLIKLIREYQPKILACDNVYELSSGKKELLAFLGEMPSGTRLVQITGGPHAPSLPSLARAHGFSIDRTDPASEANACARLAMLGVGYAVEAFEDRTVVSVSRARSLGRGGWSQNRYRRKVHGSVRAKAREIEQVLRQLAQSTGAELETSFRKGFGGYSRAEFVIPLKREMVPVSSQRHADVQVRVRAVARDRLVLTPLTRGTHHLIVGIDPGTTMGLAAIDLRGRLVGVVSERGLSQSGAIEWIRRAGTPTLIASDVLPIPHTVEKIANAFSVECTGEQLSVEDKRRLSLGYNPSNDHERDAIAAAMAAFRRAKNKLAQVEKKAPTYSNLDYIKALVLKGESIDSAILTASRDERRTSATFREKEQPLTSPEELEHTIEKLRMRLSTQKRRIERLMRYNEELKLELSRQSQHSDRLRRKLHEARQRAYIEARKSVEYQRLAEKHARLKRTLAQKDAEIQSLKKKIATMQQADQLEMSGEFVPLRSIRGFTREAIAESAPLIKEGDVLYISDVSGGGQSTAELLASLNPRAVLFDGEMAHTARDVLFSRRIPMIRAEGLVHTFNDVLVVSTHALDEAIDAWQHELAVYTRQMHERVLEEIVSEYRSQRLKETRRGD